MKLRCPACGVTGDIMLFTEAEATRQTLARLFSRTPVGMLVLRYVQLHKPATRDMSPERWNKLAIEVMDLVELGGLQHQGHTIPAPLEAWQYAVDEAYKQRDAGKLQLPLSGHGWITSVIAAYKPAAPAHAAEPIPTRPQTTVPTALDANLPRWMQQGFKKGDGK